MYDNLKFSTTFINITYKTLFLMDIQKLIDKLHPLERKVLPAIGKSGSFDEIVKITSLQDVEVMRALQWLKNKGIASVKDESRDMILLGNNGTRYIKKGLPERRLLNAIDGTMTIDEAAEKAGISKDEINIALGVLRRKAAIEIKKQAGQLKISITQQGKSLKDRELLEEQFLKKQFPLEAGSLTDEERFAYKELVKRKNILKTERVKTKDVSLSDLGKKILEKGIETEDYIERLTPAIIKTGLWKKRKFRRYDVEINVPKISGGRRHFVDQAVRYIKSIWLDMGFEEMKGTLVQTSFWDLDALFVPQDHPARDEQDTFYIRDPKYGKLPKAFLKQVKATHENGWKTGSKGWQSKWSEDKARENLMRTHTTVLSAQTISRLKKEDLPAKFFSVKRVYRNEALSWKHLFEFIQVEGIVVDPDANFKHLKGYLQNFFAKMGFPDARVRPGHFPYTEPSAEVDVWHPEKKEWIELGGSGIFRPEVVEPMMGEQVPVLAWGLGMERSIMEYYGIKDIRELYKNDLKQLREIKTWMK